ncbi:hypothetical protein HPP92_019368 [Vanilla planifolia]|uniref:Uncharacterized protein n=1 Tax=Vanilla planifolia TaxID=51239 RepID=A0A835UHH9_VANPL|nr:hypothetical protein HPP92_019368 [Vanilla planifolia]
MAGIVGSDCIVGRAWRRRRRCWVTIALIFFSPIIFPLLCLSLPLLCTALLFLRFSVVRAGSGNSRHRELHHTRYDGGFVDLRVKSGAGADAIWSGLLHRYLNDQLGLVAPANCLGDIEEECLSEIEGKPNMKFNVGKEFVNEIDDFVNEQ